MARFLAGISRFEMFGLCTPAYLLFDPGHPGGQDRLRWSFVGLLLALASVGCFYLRFICMFVSKYLQGSRVQP